MKLSLGTAALLVTALALGAVPAGAGLEPAVAVSKPRVMIVGDSVAHQFDGDYTWRYRLAREFTRQKEPVDFVGPFTWGYGTYHHYLATGWDSNHDAQGATLIKDFMDIKPVDGAPNWGRYNIYKTVKAYQPQLIVSVMGNNDVNNAMVLTTPTAPTSIRDQLKSEGRTPAVEARVDGLVDGVLKDYSSFIASARKARWNLRIVVAEVSSQLVEPWVRDKVNAALATRLRSTTSSTLVVAQTDDPKLALPGYTVDGIHTTPTGDMLFAQRIAQAINKAWRPLLGAAPRIPQVRVPWNPVLKPRITVASRQITVNWGLAARSNTVLGIRVKFTDVSKGTTRVDMYAKTASWTSDVLAPGKYTVQLQGIRGNMYSTWGAIYPVTVS
jgi:hypothetical protein